MDDDLFGEVPQPEKAPAPEAKKPLTADDIRARMLGLIAALRGAESNPFGAAELEKHIAMFPIMAQWLPDDEGKQLVFEFEEQVERLRRAA
jgi:hypothetical protein